MSTFKTTKNVEKATVITHGGTFHSDEVMATVILSKVLKDITVLRTFKVPENISEDILVYDVGFGKYDHHQKGGNGARENGVPYASCGLLWKEYGPQIVKDTPNPTLVWKMVDRDLVQGIDATDNGTLPKLDYAAQVLNISRMISGFNPSWDSQEDADEAFVRAVNFAETIFDNIFANAVANAKAQAIVEEAIAEAEGHIMVLDRFIPWQEFVLTSENQKAKELWFVVYPSLRGGYNWQCIPDALGSYGQRKTVPAEWRGATPEALREMTGVATATFCHPAGFIGATNTLEDAIEIARIASES